MSTVFRVEKTANYTVMSNCHLKDRRLSYKAKGLLSEILSLPPDWDYTLSGLAVIAKDGVDSVRTAVRELEKYGYIVRSQKRDERGRMSANEYIVYENPDQNPNYAPANEKPEILPIDSKGKSTKNAFVKSSVPLAENPTTDKASSENPIFSELPLLEKSLQKISLSENPSTVTYNILNTQELNTHQSSPSINRAFAREDEDRMDMQEERDYYRDVIRANISYDFFYENRYSTKLKINMCRINEILAIMVDVVCSKQKTIRVNGEDLPKETVKKRFLELDDTHIEYVMTALDRSKSEVRNIRAYLITALYNAPMTMGYYDAWVKHDLYGA